MSVCAQLYLHFRWLPFKNCPVFNNFLYLPPVYFLRSYMLCLRSLCIWESQLVSGLAAVCKFAKKLSIHACLDCVPSASSDLPVTAGHRCSLKDQYQEQNCRVMLMSLVHKGVFDNSFTATTDNLNEMWIIPINTFGTDRPCTGPGKC